ncbi:MAG: divalent metal cation transporter [Synergistota bacterium]|nr:divalent metal cation transporter [Synergistota bacterium]
MGYLSFLEIIRRVGPGIVLTGVVIGPGAITMASMLGAQYGYSLLWLLIPIAFMGITFMLASYRISLTTGMPIIHAIRHYYGDSAAKFVGAATFLACTFFTMGNISGTGAGMNLLFGLDWKLGSLIMMSLMVYCYFSKNVYSKIEKIVSVCILGMICAFYATLFGTRGFSPAYAVHGLTHWAFPAGSLVMALAFISTNASIMTGIYGTYLGNEKKWKRADLSNGVMLADASAHVIGVVLIDAAIILVGAIVLHPAGKTLTHPAQMADMLIPIMGDFARFVMGIALLGAAFSSLLGNTQRTVVLLNAGFDKPTGLDDKNIRWESLVVLLVAALICYGYGGSPVQLIYLSNVATAIATPVAGLFICMILWRSDVAPEMAPPRFLRVSMGISYCFCLVLTAFALINVVPKFVNSLSLAF